MMQSVQRRFGRSRTADESQVSVLLKDFEDVDKMLQRLIDASKSWRDAWRDIFAYQERLVGEFHGLYKPIPGAGPDHVPTHEPVETPQENVDRVARLQQVYGELKTDMVAEIEIMETHIVRPAIDARDSIQPLKKVIKKRQDRKLDFERAQGRFDAGNRKTNRTDKERVALNKTESDLAIQKQEYEHMDEKLRTTLPPVIAAVFSLLPRLLNTQILVQNNLLGQYYTILHNYCTEEGFPSPPPPMSEILSVWQTDFLPLQQQVETGFHTIASGKTVRLSKGNQSSLTVSNGNGARLSDGRSRSPNPSISPARSENSIPPSPNYGTKPPPPSSEPEYLTRISSVPSQSALALATPNYANGGSPSPGNEYLNSHAPAGPNADYFSRNRAPNQLANAAVKKKPPPPPPPKRNLTNQGLWVTALYDFAGQGQGDLAFREGDRIKVIKKTESTNDWWEGELAGVRGPFPANYCKV